MGRILVNKESKEVFISFNTIFYPSSYLHQATSDFSDSCWTSIDQNGKELVVKLKPKSDEINLDTLGYEFYNYVLGIIKNGWRIGEIGKG